MEQLNLSLAPALLAEAQVIAQEQRLPLEQVVNQALEHGIAGLRSVQFFRLRSGRGDVTQALVILHRSGLGIAPLAGDTVPEDVALSVE